MKLRELHVDFETFSEAPIVGAKGVGAWAYSRHPSTEVLIMAWAFDDNTPTVWLPHEPEPEWVKALYCHRRGHTLDFQINAQNDFFEYCIMLNVLGWAVPTPRYWYDVAADAAALALPRSLAGCGEALKIDVESLKDPEGKKLIKWFCQPYKAKGVAVRRMPADHVEKFNAFVAYCIQDVIAHRKNKRRMRTLAPGERLVWELDRKINLRGVRIDMDSVRDAIEIREIARAAILKQVEELTFGLLTNINSPKQIKEYMDDTFDLELENTQAEYLKTIAEDPETPELAAQIIGLRLASAKSSLAKYDKLVGIVDEIDDRAYGLLRYHGASTGRWSGNLFQPQNLPRPTFDDTDECIELFGHRDPDIIEMVYGDPLEALSSCLRGMIIASEGCRLVVSDFSQIESRMLAWLAGDEAKLDLYRNGLDIYKANAASAYSVTYEAVDAFQRKIGKVIELACGYQGAVGAFQQFAVVYGVSIPDARAKALVDAWRLDNPKIVSFWYNIEAAAVDAVKHTGKLVKHKDIKFKVVGEFLYCVLPSGRYIVYHRPHLVEGKFGDQIGFWGVDSTTGKYVHKRTYGGKLVENITQAASRCVMSDAMFRVEAEGYPIVLSVHDELITDTPKDHGSIEEFNEIMRVVPDWCEGLPLDADGYESERYRK